MDEPKDRLRLAREKAGFTFASEAARAFGWTVSTYLGHENGDRVPSRETAKRYARAFRVRWEWLLEGEGAAAASNVVTIKGIVSAGGLIESSVENADVHDGLGEIEVPFPLPDDAEAYEVKGPSMWPRYDDGDVIIVRRQPGILDELIGFEAMVTTADGNRYLKRLVKGSRKGTWDLESHNAEPMRNVKIAIATEVHSVVRANRWKSLSNKAKARLIANELLNRKKG